MRQWQGNRHHCLPVFDGLYLQSVGKAEYRHAKVIGFGSLSHRAGCAVASNVTMRPRESLRFVTEAHRHLSPVREAGCASQPQRRSTALAESHQIKACASQDGSQSAVALGVCLGSLAHRGWHPSSERVSVRTSGVLALWHMSGAARRILVSGFAGHVVFAPAHPWGLLASQLRPRGLPVRPPRGLPQNRVKTRRLPAAAYWSGCSACF